MLLSFFLFNLSFNWCPCCKFNLIALDISLFWTGSMPSNTAAMLSSQHWMSPSRYSLYNALWDLLDYIMINLIFSPPKSTYHSREFSYSASGLVQLHLNEMSKQVSHFTLEEPVTVYNEPIHVKAGRKQIAHTLLCTLLPCVTQVNHQCLLQ